MKAALIICALLVPVSGAAQSMTAEDFLRQAAEGCFAHVEAGRMAQGITTLPPSVQQLGRQMGANGVQMTERLAQLAAARNLALTNQIPAADRRTLERLSTLQGAAFTRDYLGTVLDSLERARALFQMAAMLEDAGVAQFAGDRLPGIETQLQVAGAVYDAQIP
ncbi:MAG: DUF4142 domain-containing protein [Rhodospirillaceae bacterium]|nr:DUF4142 domain-containing protein [Rhodospirillales bacterium]